MSAEAHVHESDQLINALRGDTTRAELTRLTAHLRACERCRDALVDVVLVHASLTAAGRLLHPMSAAPAQPVQQASGTVSPDAAGGTRAAEVAASTTLPPLRRDRGRRMRLVAAVAAAVVVVGTGLGVGIASRDGGSRGRPGQPSQTPASRSVALAPVTGGATGQVTMTEEPSPGQSRSSLSGAGLTAMSITTAGLAHAGPGQFYYAWLFDPATNKMLPLGIVSPERPTRFQLSDDLVSRYHAVDISLQDDNGDPAHSATSVLRATY